jgi:hypothetical protein
MMADPPLAGRRIAIVGFGSGDRTLVPWDDPAVEIWTLNNAHGCEWMRRWDRVFEMHPRGIIARETAELKRSVDHLALLQAERRRPIYMTEAQPDIPCSVAYPLEAITAFVGARCEKIRKQPFLTSSFALMLALATMKLVQTRKKSDKSDAIEIYGVPLMNDEEYAYQRENASFFAGFAMGHGVEIVMTPDSTWLEADGIYGYARAESWELLDRMRTAIEAERDAYGAQEKQLTAEYEAIHRTLNTVNGSRQYADKMIHRLTLLMRGAKL